MSRYYRVLESLSIEYEYDKGPMPSGYAKLMLRIVPKTNMNGNEDLVVPDGRFWEVSKKYSEINADKEVFEFIPTIMEGVQQGIREALVEILDHPIRDVTFFLDKIVVDPVYSTKRAFVSATKLAIKSLITDAQQRGLVYLQDDA